MVANRISTSGTIVNHLDRLPAIRDEWTEMHRDNPRTSIFNSFEYVKNWYECFAQPEQVRIYRITADDRTIGFLPLVLYRKNRFRMLGSLTNNHCYHSVPLIRAGYEDTFPALLAEVLFKDASSWDVLTHGCTYSFSELSNWLSDEVIAGHGAVLTRNLQPTFSVLLDKQFKDYFQHDLSSKTRNCLRKYIKRIEQEGSVRYVQYGGDEARRHFHDFVRLEDSGWKGAGGSSIKKCGPEYQRYYDHLITMLADRDALRLYFLEYNGQTIAGIFGYTDAGTFHSFKIAYDEQFSSFSPAHLLFIHVIEHLITSSPEIRRLHMFPSDGGYKHRFTNEEATCAENVLFGTTFRGKSLYLYSTMKNHLREIPGVLPLINRLRGKGASHTDATTEDREKS